MSKARNIETAATIIGYQDAYHKRQREALRDIGPIPAVVNPDRKRRCADNAELYCMTYLPHYFTHPFTDDEREILNDLVNCIKHGGWIAEAAARGDGKTTIALGVLSWAVNYGYLKFVLFIGANAGFAENALDDIKTLYERSEPLHEDFPEICYPIIQLDGSALRAKMQTSEGERTHLKWKGDRIVLPFVPEGVESKAKGSVFAAKGIEAALRGIKEGVLRPDFVLIDDPQTRESAYSQTELKKREETIEKDIVGMAGQGKKMSISVLCTILRKGDLADKLTDRKQKPAWQGKRFRFLKHKPDREDLWAKFIELRQIDQIAGDDTGATAHKFYLDNQKEMDAGAVIGNPYRFDPDLQSSALEYCYCKIADMGWDNFCCEFQNDPPDEAGVETTGINITAVCKKINTLERGVVPEWCEVLTIGKDVHGRMIYWVAVAWKQGMQGYIVDYGTERVNAPSGSLIAEENRSALEAAIVDALNGFAEWERENGWPMVDTGEMKHIDLALVDAGWMPDPVGSFIRGNPKYRASMGFGSTQRKKYKPPGKVIPGRTGQHFHATNSIAIQGRLWQFDADYYKNLVHRGFLTDEGPGSLCLFKQEPVKHRAFAEGICAEVWTREFIGGPKGGFKEYFTINSRHNHPLDALAQAAAAANMCGIKILTDTKKIRRRTRRVKRMQGI